MKKLNLFIAAIVCSLLVSISVKAQETTDYYAGKWALVTTGTPGGDGKATMELKRVDGKLIGSMKTDKGVESKFSRVDEKEKSVTVYFKASGYDVYIYLEKGDADHMSGSTMDMFDTTAARVVETQTETK
jgi:hypothetical protein